MKSNEMNRVFDINNVKNILDCATRHTSSVVFRMNWNQMK